MMKNKYGHSYETKFKLVSHFVAFEVKEVINEDFIRIICEAFSVVPQLKNSHVIYDRVADVIEAGANVLAENKVIGWFQGSMEFQRDSRLDRAVTDVPM